MMAVSGADRRLAVLEGIPSESDARLKVLVVCDTAARGDKRARSRIEIREPAAGFRGGRVPAVAQADIDREV